MRQLIHLIFVLASAKLSAQQVVSSKLSQCDLKAYTQLLQTRIVSKEVKSDTLLLNIGFLHNCCAHLKPQIKASNDTLFLTMENSSKTNCLCNCCFEMEIKVSDVSDTSFVLMWGETELKVRSKYPKLPHEYVITKDTPKNKRNADGLKVGLWIEKVKSHKGKYEAYYELNPVGEEILLWRRVYDKKGELQRIEVMVGDTDHSFFPEEYSNIFQ